MTDDDTRKPSKKEGPGRKTWQIDEFYRLADQVHSGFSDPDLAERRRREWAKERLSQSIEASTVPPPAPSAIELHRWVIDVLADLADLAGNEQLHLLHECLRDTHFLVQEMLTDDTISEGSEPSERPDGDCD
jgi:hypothetical protein